MTALLEVAGHPGAASAAWSRSTTCRSPSGRAEVVGLIGPERRRQDDALRGDRRLHAVHRARCTSAGDDISDLRPAPAQPPRPGALVPGRRPLRRPHRAPVRDGRPAARRAGPRVGGAAAHAGGASGRGRAGPPGRRAARPPSGWPATPTRSSPSCPPAPAACASWCARSPSSRGCCCSTSRRPAWPSARWSSSRPCSAGCGSSPAPRCCWSSTTCPLVLGMSRPDPGPRVGPVIADGTPEEVRNDPEVQRSYLGGDPTAIQRSGVAVTRPGRSRRPEPGGSVDPMHPIERLRYVARASGADQALLVRETAQALVGLPRRPGRPGGRAPAASSTATRPRGRCGGCAPGCSPRPTANREAWDAVDEISGDPTPTELAYALEADITVCLIGWPELVGEALPRRGDVEVLAVDSLGEGSGLVRRLMQAGIDAVDVPTSGLGAAVAASTCCSSRRWPPAPTGFVAVSGSLAAATVARHAEVPGVGRRRRGSLAAGPHVDRARRPAGTPAPRTRGTSTRRSCRFDLVDRVCGPGGLEPPADAAPPHRLPRRPRAVRPRQRPRHLHRLNPAMARERGR